MALQKLFTPLSIGRTILRNRIMCSPCELSDSPNGIPSQQILDHYVEMAKGECGLIVPGACHVMATGATGLMQGGVSTAKQVRAWQGAIAQMHELGSKVVFQVMHGGPQALDPVNVAALSGEEVSGVIAQYAAAASRLEAVGAAGIQLHAAHGYFLSSLLSLKPDLGVETLVRTVTAVREATSRDFLVGVKINGQEAIPGLAGGPEFIGRALQLAAPDFAEISIGGGFGGTIRSNWNADRIAAKVPEGAKAVLEAAKGSPRPTEGYTLEAARVIKSMNPGVVVASVGGWKTAAAMSNALDRVDLVSLGRPFIREPQLAKHLREGASEVECVRCGQCILLFREVNPVRCFLKEGYLK